MLGTGECVHSESVSSSELCHLFPQVNGLKLVTLIAGGKPKDKATCADLMVHYPDKRGSSSMLTPREV